MADERLKERIETDAGPVEIWFPGNMSVIDVQELEERLVLFIRTRKRIAASEEV